MVEKKAGNGFDIIIVHVKLIALAKRLNVIRIIIRLCLFRVYIFSLVNKKEKSEGFSYP